MIEAIAALGERVKADGEVYETDQFTENPNTKGKDGSVIMINLKKEEDIYIFDNVDFKDYEGGYYSKILYPPKVSQGISNSPTCKITEVEKSYTNKILNYFKKDFPFLTEEENQEIKAIYSCLNRNKTTILDLIEEKVKGLSKKAFRILTVSIDGKMPLEIDLLKQSFLNLSRIKLGTNKENQSCACCLKTGRVYGEAFPLSFFTVDKPGFAYGLDKSVGYKMLPLCYDCAIHLNLGVKFMRENLNHRFYWENYFLIPHFLNKIDDKILKRMMGMRNFSTSDDTKEQFEMDEAVIWRKLNQDLNNTVNFSLLFYKEENSAFNILCLIEDVFPSIFKNIFEQMDKTNENKLFARLFSVKPHLKFNFGVVRYFFPKENSRADALFFNVVSDIIKGIKIDYKFLLSAFMKKIEETFRRGYNIEEPTIKALVFLMFLQNMNLLKNVQEGKLMQNIQETKSAFVKSIREFFEVNEKCYNTNEKRAAFLIGCLVNNVLYAQYKDLKSTPFSHRLKGLKLDLQSLKLLFNESIIKLEQYKKKGVNEPLIQEISNYFAMTDSIKWKLSNVDINFFVAQGLSLAKQFIPSKLKEDDENE